MVTTVIAQQCFRETQASFESVWLPNFTAEALSSFAAKCLLWLMFGDKLADSIEVIVQYNSSLLTSEFN